MKISDEGVYTKGKSFRAIAEGKARQFRINDLHLPEYDKYGHILAKKDGDQGLNFLPSLRNEIYRAVIERNNKGKGIDVPRTTQNMLSSKAMCFNLFAPLNLDKKFASRFFKEMIPDFEEMDDLEIEYTPSNFIFNDQSIKGGVDCDALLKYRNHEGKNALMVIETKFVETEFSKCGFRKSNKKNICPVNTMVTRKFSFCRYHLKKHYNYWKITKESDLFNLNFMYNNPCPFGSTLWQLWVNMSLAYALAEEFKFEDFSYALICPEENEKLSNCGKTFLEFKKLLKKPEKFKIIYLGDLKKAFEELGKDNNQLWTDEFIKRYCF